MADVEPARVDTGEGYGGLVRMAAQRGRGFTRSPAALRVEG
jgi:hypothetical protein